MKKVKKIKKWLLKNKFLVIVFGIFLFELFLRFYQLEIKNPFGYDQVDNAWAAQKIIANHDYPLVGMVAKGNSGIYIGPFYYYLISIVYFIFNLNPIASSVIAGLTSIFTFWTIYFVGKKLFSKEVALVAVFINTFALPAILFDRVQWPVNLIPSISILIFYCLYRITQGEVKKIIHLALLVGFSFSLHFTSVFFPIIILFTLPFFPRNKEAIKYILLSIPLFLILLIPNIINQFSKSSGGNALSSYLATYYHGFHLRRVLQLAGDGLIQFNAYLYLDKLAVFKFLALPLFFLGYLHKANSRKNLIFCYLVLLWFIVPWFAFATYRGEISDYYFSINRFLALFIVSYFFVRIWLLKNIIAKAAVVLILVSIAVLNVINYLPYEDNGLAKREKQVTEAMKSGQVFKYQQGVPESYIYYYFTRNK